MVKEYLLVRADPGAPFQDPSLYELYYGITGDKMATLNVSFEPVEEGEPALKGGFMQGRKQKKDYIN